VSVRPGIDKEQKIRRVFTIKRPPTSAVRHNNQKKAAENPPNSPNSTEAAIADLKRQLAFGMGKYVDPRIVAGLIDRPEPTDAKGSRREMTILFCDMPPTRGPP
jgi:hypothetical protein